LRTPHRSTPDGTLACPACRATFGGEERFCPQCSLPLVLAAGELPRTRAAEQARKIRPQLAEGPLVRIAGTRGAPEAQLIQSLLLEQGVPSIVRPMKGIALPDWIVSGPREVFVPASGADVARDALAGAPSRPRRRPAAVPWVRGLAVVLLAILIVGTAALAVAGPLR
jgi:hypothetical protein